MILQLSLIICRDNDVKCTLQAYIPEHQQSPSHSVADRGATSVMVVKDTPMKNVCPATNPLNINLLDGTIENSKHVCDLEIPGLPYV